jgi:hypothetical protein
VAAVKRNSRTELDVAWRGLRLCGEYSYDPGCRTLPNGDPGWPPSQEATLGSVELDDDLMKTDGVPEVLADLSELVGPAAARLADAWIRMSGTLPECIADWVVDAFEDEINEALCHAGQEARDNPDDGYDEDKDEDRDLEDRKEDDQ